MQDGLAALADNLLGTILVNGGRAAEARTVCKDFRRIYDLHNTSNLVLHGPAGVEQKVADILRLSPSLTTLSVKGNCGMDLAQIFHAQHLTSIRELRLLPPHRVSLVNLPALSSLQTLRRFDSGGYDLRPPDMEALGALSGLTRLDLAFSLACCPAALPPLLRRSTGLLHLDISHNTSIDMDAVGQALTNLPRLQHLALWSSVTGDDAALAPHLTALSALRTLELGHIVSGRSVAEAMALTLSSLSALQVLRIDNLHDHKRTAWAVALAPALGRLTALQQLSLSDNNIEDAALASPLRLLTALTHLDLAETNLHQALLLAIGHLSRLVRLGLRSTNLDGRQSVLAESLSHLPSLQYLDVSRNRMATFVLPAAAMTALHHLDLSHNDLGRNTGRGLDAVLAALCHWLVPIRHLNLSNNKIMSSSARFASLGNLTSLTHLDLSSNCISYSCDIKDLAPQLAHLSLLRHLDLSNNGIYLPLYMEVLVKHINPLRRLQHIRLSGNNKDCIDNRLNVHLQILRSSVLDRVVLL